MDQHIHVMCRRSGDIRLGIRQLGSEILVNVPSYRHRESPVHVQYLSS
jgi:hypothetical protein